MKFKSQVMTQASGSIGGITYSHNKGGMYTRSRAVPTNPNTTRQAIVRGAFGGMVQMWNALSDVDREAWRLYASNVPVLDRLGDMIHLSGQQMFIRVASFIDGANMSLAGLTSPPSIPFVSSGPIVFNTGEPVVVIDSASDTDGAFALAATLAAPASLNGTAMLQVGRPQNPGVKFYKGPYQFAAFDAFSDTDTSVAFAAADVTDPLLWGSDYLPSGGTMVPFRIRLIYADGRLSQPYSELLLVEALEP